MSPFFPPGETQTQTFAAYLNSLAGSLASLSEGPELLSAFSAFDDDDSGQVDLAELRRALLDTPPEEGRAPSSAEVDRILGDFSGRRAFSKTSHGGAPRRGEVFKYHDFVNSVTGGGGGGANGASPEPGSHGTTEE